MPPDIRLPTISPKPLDESSRSGIARDLSNLITGEVRFDQHNRLLYATDASLYQVEPLGVVCPRNIDEAEKVVRYCSAHDLPILPRGGGTSLAGQAVNRAIVIDFSVHCRGLIEVNVAEQFARVQPGMVLDQLNASLAPHQLMFGPDVATSAHANIGGMIGNNSAGAYSILYGRTVEHLRGMDALLADGIGVSLDEGAATRSPAVRDLTQRIANIILPRESLIERRFPKTVRHVNGYNLDLILNQLHASTPGTFDKVNLAHLVCGSEGTLAVTVEAKLNLVPKPKITGLAIVAFADVDASLRALMQILATRPAAVELIDDVVIGIARENREYRRYVELLPAPPGGSPGAVMYVAYFGDSADQLHHKFDELQSHFPGHTINRYTRPSEIQQAWKLRKAGEPLLHGLHGARRPLTFIEDCAVDPKHLPEFIAEFRQLVARHGTTAAYYAHASVGCLHIRPMINLRDAGDRTTMQAMIEEATDLVMRYGGALSGEHGDGRVRSHLLERFYGREICDAFRAVKAVFDPKNLLNPGNIIAPLPMLDHIRLRPEDKFINVPKVETFFRYECEHGFAEAVEMCNGAGVCRKMKGGTMCPSFRATLDERHATRGRGNALRLAITGQFSSDGESPAWNDPATKETLDLCLSCKACKSECPSNVDVAKLKSEYLAQGYARGARVPLASQAFGNIRLINRIGSALHPIANTLAGFAPVKAMSGRILNLHPERELPRFAKSLYRWMQHRQQIDSPVNRPAVILYPDCFTVYNEPHIGRAAVLTLEALGYRVVLPKLEGGCCGRAMISGGMLKQAAQTCSASARSLLECVAREQAIAVVGCEPSCVSAIKDEWVELELGIEAGLMRELAHRTFLIEQFVEESWGAHPRVPAIDVTPVPGIGVSGLCNPLHYVLHAHCHQKALWGAESSSKVLTRLVGDNLQVLDSGCCGMAGSFGYGRHHFDLSMKIGEQSLFGSLREKPDATILAPGTSCRQQIHDGLQRKARHPIELIAQMLGEKPQ